MNLSGLSIQELKNELDRRTNTNSTSDFPTLVVGTLGFNFYGGKVLPFVELFKKVEKPEDLELLPQIRLRARFNPQRKYRLFYFKTNSFDKLNEHLEKDNTSFAQYVLKTSSVKFENL